MSGRVLFFPEAPSPLAVITRICRAAGCAIVTDPRAAFDLAIAWDTNTFRRPVPTLERLARDIDVWNLECTDIGKARVDEVFQRTFGYASLIDPVTYHGRCVSKSNLNAAHDGVVIDAPVTLADAGRVYQRLIRNELSDGTIEDIRAPVFGDEIPFVYLKYRPIESRFDQFEIRVAVEDTSAVFTRAERAQIVGFVRAMGLDYGELDVLRDREDGRLYIVDANPTPFGPPNLLAPREQTAVVGRLADAFERLRGRREHRPQTVGGFEPESRAMPGDRNIGSVESARPDLSVVVVARNEGRFLRTTLAHLCDTLPAPNEIILVDDGSDDGSTEDLSAAYPRARIIRTGGLGVARGRNLGALQSRGDVIVFADAHLVIPPGWWTPLLAAVNGPGVGGAAPAIANLDRPWQVGYGLRFSGFDLDVEWLPRLGDGAYPVPLMPWCFGAMRRDVFDATGGFDTGMIQWGSIDNEMSVRLWSLGYELKVVPEIEVAHYFRDDRPYPIAWMPVVHNRLRLALVHFEVERMAGVIRALADQPDFAAAIARAVTGDAATRRNEVAARRVRDCEWLFEHFDDESSKVGTRS